jgi:hypothetical protein
MGKLLTCLPRLTLAQPDSRLHNCERFGPLQNVLATDLENSHRPDGNIADVLASTLACTIVTDALVNYSKYVLHRT